MSDTEPTTIHTILWQVTPDREGNSPRPPPQFYLMTPDEKSGGAELKSLKTKEDLEDASSLALESAPSQFATNFKFTREFFKHLVESAATSVGYQVGPDDQYGVVTSRGGFSGNMSLGPMSGPTTLYGDIEWICGILSSVAETSMGDWLCTAAQVHFGGDGFSINVHTDSNPANQLRVTNPRLKFGCSPGAFTKHLVKEILESLESSATEASGITA